MTLPEDPLRAKAAEYERRARKEEASSLPTFIKLGRAVVWIAYALVILNTVLLTLAFFLSLFGANPNAGFTQWVYRSSGLAMRPFRGIFPPVEVSDHSVLDTSLLFAILVYVFLVAALAGLLHWLGLKLYDQRRRTAQFRAQADALAIEVATSDQQARHAASAASYPPLARQAPLLTHQPPATPPPSAYPRPPAQPPASE